MRLLTNPSRRRRASLSTVTVKVEADQIDFTPAVGQHITRSGYVARVEGVELDNMTYTLVVRELHSPFMD